MRESQIANRIDDKLGEHFVTREKGARGHLFLTADSIGPGKLLRLLITFEAWSDYKNEIPEAINRAIKILRQRGGDVVIRETKAGGLIVRRQAVGA